MIFLIIELLSNYSITNKNGQMNIIQKYVKSLFASELKKNTLNLVSANTISQGISLIVYPFITRIYSPEEFGAYSIFLTICGIFLILSTGRYESAILLPKSQKDAIAVFHLCITISFYLCISIFLIILFFKNYILSLLSIEILGKFIYFIPIVIFLNAITILLIYWFNRNKQFQLTARYNIAQSLCTNFFKLGFGKIGLTKFGLIISTFLGYIAAILSVIFSKKGHLKKLFRYDKIRIKKVAKIYQNYPRYTLIHAFVDMLSNSLPSLIFATFFGTHIVGIYSLVMAIGFRPINLITGSFNQIFFQQISSLYNKKQSIYPILSKFCTYAFIVLLPLFLTIYFLSSTIINNLFGNDWSEAISILNILLPWFFVSVFAGTFCFIPSIFFKQKIAMILEIGCAIVRLIAILIGIFWNNYLLSIICYSFVSTLYIIILLFWYNSIIRNYEKQL